MASGSARRKARSSTSGIPWSRILVGVSVALPPLALGGVHPEFVLGFALLVGVTWARVCTQVTEPIALPRGTALLLVALGWSLFQWLPLPGTRQLLAPDLAAVVADALSGMEGAVPGGIAISRPDAGLELARLAALAALFVCGSAVSWRFVATIIAVTGLVVSLLSFAHLLAGSTSIYGLYTPVHVDLARVPHAFGSFVNPNNQAGFLLLSTGATGAMAVAEHGRATRAVDLAGARVHLDRVLAALGALVIQIVALILTLSRGGILTLLLLGPFAVFMGMRALRLRGRGTPRQRMSWMQLAFVAALLALVVFMIRGAAWDQLLTLTDLSEQGIAAEQKLQDIVDAEKLRSLAPLTGIGAGSYADLSSMVRQSTSGRLGTHLESAPWAMVVRWGPVGIVLAVGAALVWWRALVASRSRTSAMERQIALLGVAAAGLQGCVDHWWSFLGVSAPLCALMGSLSVRGRALPHRPVLVTGLAALGLAISVAWSALPGAWSHRPARDAALLAGDLDPARELHERPLDAHLHRTIARVNLGAAHPEPARARARASTMLAPGSIDGWLLLAAAERELGDEAAAGVATARALRLVARPIDDAMADHLVSLHPRVEDLAARMPSDAVAWRNIVLPLAKRWPAHADGLAAARAEADPVDPWPLQIRARLALDAGFPALALHHARLMQARSPGSGRAANLVARAYRAFDPPRTGEAIGALEAVLASDALVDPTERGLVEETLIGILASGDAQQRQRARELLPELMRRPGNRKMRQRRARLRARLQE